MSIQRFGKVNYSTIKTPNNFFVWYYSYQELQDKLNDTCKNQTLKKVYVNLGSYLESLHHSANSYDFSYLGGTVLFTFDNIAIEVEIHGTGMVQCRIINLWDIKITSTKDFPPSNMYERGANYFYDLSEQFELDFENKKVINVSVDRINCYPFPYDDFDEVKAQIAEKSNSLPNAIHLHLNNGVDFGIYADWCEYFYIELLTYV